MSDSDKSLITIEAGSFDEFRDRVGNVLGPWHRAIFSPDDIGYERVNVHCESAVQLKRISDTGYALYYEPGGVYTDSKREDSFVADSDEEAMAKADASLKRSHMCLILLDK